MMKEPSYLRVMGRQGAQLYTIAGTETSVALYCVGDVRPLIPPDLKISWRRSIHDTKVYSQFRKEKVQLCVLDEAFLSMQNYNELPVEPPSAHDQNPML